MKQANRPGGAISASYMVAADGGGASCASNSASSCAASTTYSSCAKRCIAATSCSSASHRQRPRQGAPLSPGRRQQRPTDNAGFDEALHPARRGRERRRDEGDVRARRGNPGEVRDAHLCPVAQNLLLADRYLGWPRVPCGRRRAPCHTYRGSRHNSGVGDAIDLSWKLAATCKDGVGLRCSTRTNPNGAGRRAQRRRLRYASLGRRKWHAQYRPNIRENTPDGVSRA